jgi:hypothetical protein
MPRPARDRIRTTFYIDADLQDGLSQLRDRDGVPVAEAIRRAIRAYLESKSITLKTKRGAKR